MENKDSKKKKKTSFGYYNSKKFRALKGKTSEDIPPPPNTIIIEEIGNADSTNSNITDIEE